MKKALLYLLLILLIILLLLPVGLRIFAKDLYNEAKEDDKPTKNIVDVLKCNKNDEMIRTTYLNSSPYNFYYKVNGNHALNTDDEMIIEPNEIIGNITNYSDVTYNEVSDITEYSINLNEMTDFPEKLLDYTKSVDNQSQFYTSKGFTCERETLDN